MKVREYEVSHTQAQILTLCDRCVGPYMLDEKSNNNVDLTCQICGYKTGERKNE